MSEEKTEQLILEVEKTIFFDKFRHDYRQGRSQPNTGGGERNSGGTKYLSSICKFEVENRHKSAEESKT